MDRCEICGAPHAGNRCRICGRRVCDRHYDASRGICLICSSALCEICGSRLATSYCQVCGRYVCPGCSVQLTPVMRVCVECFSKLGREGVLRELEASRRQVPRLPPIRLLAERIARKYT
ncbi:MAG: B-box zinc finger protein [Candidatus Korarchaeota archaeon]|nr:B-box zinc finger protein [Candidatus Korarchaeota archaeon]